MNVVREDPKVKGLLFAGTERDVYVSFDDGDDWQPLSLNLPQTSVRDLIVHGDDLAVATHGRGFWILDDMTPLRELANRSPERLALRPRRATATSAVGARAFQPSGRSSTSRRPPTASAADNWPDTPLPPEFPAGQEPARRRDHRLLPRRRRAAHR